MIKYSVCREIGGGSFGKVFLVEHRQSGIEYVIKKITKNKLTAKEMKEVEVLSKLKQNNVVCYKEYFLDKDTLNIVMEYCHNGDLHDRIQEKAGNKEKFQDVEIFEYVTQLCLALQYIHQRKILHRDVKSKNVFVTKSNKLKLGDFGIAKILENTFELAQTCIGSPFYLSPEICRNKPYNSKSDMWAFGCVLFELCTLKYAFVAKNMKILLMKIIKGSFGPLPTDVDVNIRSLLTNLLSVNPNDRYSAGDILKKPYLTFYKQKFEPRKNPQVTRSMPTLNNEKTKRSLLPIAKKNIRLCETNQMTLNETKSVVTPPKMKYGPVLGNRTKMYKRTPTPNELSSAKPINGQDFYKASNYGHVNINQTSSKPEPTKIAVKLPKVDSLYYNMIAECTGSYKDGQKDRKKTVMTSGSPGWNPEVDLLDINGSDVTSEEELDPLSMEAHKKLNRKKWFIETVEKNDLLAALHDADLCNSTVVNSDGFVTQVFLGGTKEVSIDNTIEDLENFLRFSSPSNNTTEHLTRTYSLPNIKQFNSNKEHQSMFSNLEDERRRLERLIDLDRFKIVYQMLVTMLEETEIRDEVKDTHGTETYVIDDVDLKLSLAGGVKRKINVNKWDTALEILNKDEKLLEDVWNLVLSDIVYQQQ